MTHMNKSEVTNQITEDATTNESLELEHIAGHNHNIELEHIPMDNLELELEHVVISPGHDLSVDYFVYA